MLNRKSDFILEYIEETGKNITVDTNHDIDISNVRYKREINR